MRGKPFDLEVLCDKISKVSWEPQLRAMQKGWLAIWKQEWIFLWTGLTSHLDKNPDDKLAANIVRKLGCHGYNDYGVSITNKLYLTKGEQPWLIDWIRVQMLTCEKCGRHTGEIFVWGDEQKDLCRPCFQEVVR